MNTELVLYTGPMFSSKTTRLLQKIDRLRYQGKATLSFKPKMDDRYSVDGVIVTHNDAHVKCFQVENGKEILEIIASSNVDVDCVAVDEIFMIPGAAEACIKLFRKGYDVFISSIELNFLGEPFEEVKEVMPYCTEIVKCTAVCTICRSDARYTSKKIQYSLSNANVKIQVGGEELYEPRCQAHHDYMKE